MIGACVPLVFHNHAKLLLEPWCLTPAQVARLTQEQVAELYLKPAGRINDILKRQRDGEEGVSGGANPFAGVKTYEDFRLVLMSHWPDAERTEDQMRESWKRFNGSD